MKNAPAFQYPLLSVIAGILLWASGPVWPGPPIKSATSSLRQVEVGEILGEFEGRYRVGPTTCTVTPVKMAFEVRWAKGHGVMRFFFDSTTPDGKAIFVSEDLGKGSDKFIFDDNRYHTGKFIRADGKSFLLKRISGGGLGGFGRRDE